MEANDQFDKRETFPQHLTRYFGKLTKDIYVWQCAYSDCKAMPCVLPGQIWDRLREYDRLDRCYKRKEYDSADVALKDMRRATNECNECEERRKAGNTVGS